MLILIKNYFNHLKYEDNMINCSIYLIINSYTIINNKI